MGRWAAGLCLSTPGANLPPARPSRLIFALPVVLCRAVLPAVPCLQVWDLSTGAVRQTLERAHSGSEVPCITDLTVWEGHIVSASLDGLIKIWEPADPASGLIVNPTPIFTFPEQVRYWVARTGWHALCGAATAAMLVVMSCLACADHAHQHTRLPRDTTAATVLCAGGWAAVRRQAERHPGAVRRARRSGGVPLRWWLAALLSCWLACLLRPALPNYAHHHHPPPPSPPTPPPQNRCVLMASYNGERCIRMWELPSFEARGTLADVNNARAMAGSASAQLVFSGDEHGRVKVWKWKLVGAGGFPVQ